MEKVLQGLTHVCVNIDDIHVREGSSRKLGWSNEEECWNDTKRLNCEFMLPAVEYQGKRFQTKGLWSTEEKVQPIVEAPAPHSVSLLKASLHMLNYYVMWSEVGRWWRWVVATQEDAEEHIPAPDLDERFFESKIRLQAGKMRFAVYDFWVL